MSDLLIEGVKIAVLAIVQPYAGHPHFHPSWLVPDTPV